MAKMTRRVSLVLLSGALFAGCNSRFFSPTAPSGTSGLPWSSFIGIHASGEAHEAYQTVIPILRDRGNMVGARVGLTASEGINGTIKMIGSLGIELVGIIDNEYLLDPDIEARIDEIYAAYPEITYFQVGNEVTNPNINSATMSVVHYMVALRRVYDHTQSRYTDKMLITQSPRGTGDYSRELEEMVSLGLREMSPQKLIIGINVYSDYALVGYSDKIRKYLSGYRIWVMETGNSDPSQQVQFVQNFYPQLRTSLRAERIYWYVMWAGDDDIHMPGSESGFNLISNVLNPPLIYSPLFNKLAGVEE